MTKNTLLVALVGMTLGLGVQLATAGAVTVTTPYGKGSSATFGTLTVDTLDAGVACINGQEQVKGPLLADNGIYIPQSKCIYLDSPTNSKSICYDGTSINVVGIGNYTQAVYVGASGIVGPLAGGSPAPLFLRSNSSNNQLAKGVQLDTSFSYAEPIAHLFEVNNHQVGQGFGDPNGFYSLAAPHPAEGREIGWWTTAGNTAATTFTGIGLTAPSSPTGTNTAQPALTSATRMYIQYAGAASANAVAGLNGGSFTQTRPGMRPKMVARWRTDSAITNRRIYAGVASATLATTTVAAGPTGSAVTFAAVGYEAGVNSGKAMCCSGDASNYSCVDMGVTVAVSTEYMSIVDWGTSGTLVCCLTAPGQFPGYPNTDPSGVVTVGCTEKTTNLSSAATDIGIYLANTTANSSAENMQINAVSLEQGTH